MKTSKFLADEILHDIDAGYFDQFNKLKNRLQYIADKLYRITFVINADPLSRGELKTLAEQGYISEWEINGY